MAFFALLSFFAGLYISYGNIDLMVWFFLLSFFITLTDYFRVVRFAQYIKKYILGISLILVGATFLEYTLDLFLDVGYWDAFYFAIFFLCMPYTLYFFMSFTLKNATGSVYSDKGCYVCYKRPKTLGSLVWALFGGQFGHKSVIVDNIQYSYHGGVFQKRAHVNKKHNIYFKCNNDIEYLEGLLGTKFKLWNNCFIVLRKFKKC